ncbi:hypothetical protein Angca_007331, partial [Angiostrongylus cantonensis]
EKVDNDTTYVAMEEVPEPPPSNTNCALCTCNIPVKLSYSDVLILEQFMREDGTVLPRQLTGLCKKQQLRLERCVMQAHWAGLFPDKTIPEFDRAGYKRFNRYWNDDMDMYRLKEKNEVGSWFYIKRYPTESTPLAVDLPLDPCPVVLGCMCINHDVTVVECFDVGPESLPQLLKKYPSLYSLRLSKWREQDLKLNDFSSFKHLKKLFVTASETNTISISLHLPSITHLILDNNMFVNTDQFCNITRYLPSLVELSLSGNELTHLPQCIENLPVNTLRLRRNGITWINGSLNKLTRNVDLSWNILRTASGLHKNLLNLNLSYNPLTEAIFPTFLTLRRLDLSGSKFAVAPRLNAPALVELTLNSTNVEVVNFNYWVLPNLQRL